jgi:hypothetical protein
MDYKIVITDEEVSDETAEAIFGHLQKMVIDSQNIDMKNFSPFRVEGKEATLIGTTWGVQRSDSEDMAELSETFPDVTFHFIQVSKILNEHHFDALKHYSLSVYQDGMLREVMKPEPIVWKSSQVMQILENPWA